MQMFRFLLVVIFVSIAIYTGFVVTDHGINLLPVFFGDIAEMAWPGQFNFDFLCFLMLSGTWVAWRHQFTSAGLVLGLFAFFGGAFFLSGYLFYQSYASKGNVPYLLMGANSTA